MTYFAIYMIVGLAMALYLSQVHGFLVILRIRELVKETQLCFLGLHPWGWTDIALGWLIHSTVLLIPTFIWPLVFVWSWWDTVIRNRDPLSWSDDI